MRCIQTQDQAGAGQTNDQIGDQQAAQQGVASCIVVGAFLFSDEFNRRGVNSVERKPFRPFRLLLILIAVVTTLSVFSQVLARWAGVY